MLAISFGPGTASRPADKAGAGKTHPAGEKPPAAKVPPESAPPDEDAEPAAR